MDCADNATDDATSAYRYEKAQSDTGEVSVIIGIPQLASARDTRSVTAAARPEMAAAGSTARPREICNTALPGGLRLPQPDIKADFSSMADPTPRPSPSRTYSVLTKSALRAPRESLWKSQRGGATDRSTRISPQADGELSPPNEFVSPERAALRSMRS
jgi:hypothetical protein